MNHRSCCRPRSWRGSAALSCSATTKGPTRTWPRPQPSWGTTHGIVTEVDGLLCLTSDALHPGHYETATGMAGKRAEVFGYVNEDDGLRVVRVTLSREAS